MPVGSMPTRTCHHKQQVLASKHYFEVIYGRLAPRTVGPIIHTMPAMHGLLVPLPLGRRLVPLGRLLVPLGRRLVPLGRLLVPLVDYCGIGSIFFFYCFTHLIRQKKLLLYTGTVRYWLYRPTNFNITKLHITKVGRVNGQQCRRHNAIALR